MIDSYIFESRYKFIIYRCFCTYYIVSIDHLGFKLMVRELYYLLKLTIIKTIPGLDESARHAEIGVYGL
jgi:hypothetical protein